MSTVTNKYVIWLVDCSAIIRRPSVRISFRALSSYNRNLHPFEVKDTVKSVAPCTALARAEIPEDTPYLNVVDVCPSIQFMISKSALEVLLATV